MEMVLNHKQVVELLNEVVEKLLSKYQGYLTGCEILDEEEDIIRKEVILRSKTDFGITLELGGWIELDKRTRDIWANLIIIIPELNVSFGGGCENDYRVLRAEYDVEKGEWGEFYIDSL